MKSIRKANRTGFWIAMFATSLCLGAQAQSAVTMSDGKTLSIKLNAKQCTLTENRSDGVHWVDLRVVARDAGGAASGDRFAFRIGEDRGRPVELLEIVIAGEAPYGPVSLYDVLEAELMANMDSWSAEKIGSQEDMIDEADGQPLHQLRDIAILVEDIEVEGYFRKVRSEERIEKSRVAPVSVQASGLNAANSEDFVTATIALNGQCKVQFMTN